MKTLLLTCGLTAAMLAAGSGMAAAQSAERATISVPFSFEAGGHMLPAGQYEVWVDDDTPDVLELQGIGHPTAHSDLLTISDDREDPTLHHPAFRFARHNGVMVLQEFVDPGWEAQQLVPPRG